MHISYLLFGNSTSNKASNFICIFYANIGTWRGHFKLTLTSEAIWFLSMLLYGFRDDSHNIVRSVYNVRGC